MRQNLGGLAQRAQRRILLEEPGVDHLAGEVERLARRGIEFGILGADALGRPVRA
jgi:hypothetical protein